MSAPITIVAGGAVVSPARVCAGPIELGIAGGMVVELRPGGRASASKCALDWRDRVVLPGLINLHAHLEYTHMAHRIAARPRFSAWIREMVAQKDASDDSALLEARGRGAAWCLRGGTTTVLDVLSRTADLGPLPPGGPRLLEARELMDLPLASTTDTALAAARAWLEGGVGAPSAPSAGAAPVRRWRGLAPHAPYTCSGPLLAASARLAARRGAVWSLHLAESEEEWEAFAGRRGGMWELLRGVRPEWGADWGGHSPAGYVAPLLPRRCIVAHANYLGPGDPESLAAAEATVVHCPLSHAYFGHAPFPHLALMRARVNLALGSDSLATLPGCVESTRGLDLAVQAAHFRRGHPAVGPAAVMAMMTTHPARALGFGGRLGVLDAGACADLFALPLSDLGPDPAAWIGAWLDAAGAIPVMAVMVAGAVEWAA